MAQKINELVAENTYTIFPALAKQTGIEKIVAKISKITDTVVLDVFYSDNAVIQNKHVKVLTTDEVKALQRQVNRLNRNIENDQKKRLLHSSQHDDHGQKDDSEKLRFEISRKTSS